MSDTAKLEEIRERHRFASDEWDPIRTEARKDMKYVSGDPWEEKDRKQRNEAGRPCLTLDELGQYHNQVINNLRSNPRGVKFSPTGNGASEQGATFYQNKMREIEYRSSAQIAYITAAENMIQRSYGWIRVTTKYEHDRSFAQDIGIEPIVNPDAVLPDPDATWPDSRDMKFLLYLESRRKKEFTKEFPGAKIQDFGAELMRLAPLWIRSDTVQIGEYWTKEAYERTLLLFEPIPRNGQSPVQVQPVSFFKDELKDGRGPEGHELKRQRTVDAFKVRQYLTNGVEILKTTDWAGKHIPFVSAFGKVLYVDSGAGSKRQILSMTRLARDPFMLYCYYRTCEAELVGMTPKFPYFIFEGQLAPDELLALQKSLHEPVAVIQVKPTVDGAPQGQVLGFPQRQPYEPPIQGLEVGAEAARRAIQAAMGISPLPTPMQRQNEKSGKALQRIESSQQKGSFHFEDHYNGMIQRVGVIVEDLMDKIHDTAKDVWVQKADGMPIQQRINDPQHPDSVDTKGDYLVTVSVGPSDDSTREAASDFMDTLAGNIGELAQLKGPQVASAIMAKTIRMKEAQLGPIAMQIADLLDPPQKNGQQPNPELAAAQGQIQQLTGQLQQMAQEKQAKQTELQGQFQIEAMKATKQAQTQIELHYMDNAAKIEVARISASKAALNAEAAAAEERLATGLELAHATIEGAKDRLHDAAEAAKSRIHEAGMAHLEHAHGLEATAQQAQFSADQAQQQQAAEAQSAQQQTGA